MDRTAAVTPAFRLFDHFRARYAPKGGPPEGAADWVGRELEWETGWLIQQDEDSVYAGQWACTPSARWCRQERQEGRAVPPFSWVPQCHLELTSDVVQLPPPGTQAAPDERVSTRRDPMTVELHSRLCACRGASWLVTAGQHAGCAGPPGAEAPVGPVSIPASEWRTLGRPSTTEDYQAALRRPRPAP